VKKLILATCQYYCYDHGGGPGRQAGGTYWPGHILRIGIHICKEAPMGDKNPKNIQKQKKNNDNKKNQKKTPATPAVKK
jgi:hypothetical protein